MVVAAAAAAAVAVLGVLVVAVCLHDMRTWTDSAVTCNDKKTNEHTATSTINFTQLLS